MSDDPKGPQTPHPEDEPTQAMPYGSDDDAFWSTREDEPDSEPFWTFQTPEEQPPDEDFWPPTQELGVPETVGTFVEQPAEPDTAATPPVFEQPVEHPVEPPVVKEEPVPEFFSFEPETEFFEAEPYHEPTSQMAQAPPVFTPRALSKRQAATLALFAEVLLPRGGAVAFSASDVGVAERLDSSLQTWDPRARRTFTRVLTWFEWQALLSRSLRPFSKLSPSKASDALARASRSRFLARRGPVEMLKFYCGNQWAASPSVEEKIEFTYRCVTSDPPRDGQALEVLSYPQITRDHMEECDVVVVGSGAGGAVMAKELAEIGVSVIVIEEGPYFTRKDFTGPPFERFQRLYRRSGLTGSLGRPAIALPMGMAVGGSTLVNSGTCFRTPDRVLQRWGSEFGIEGIDPESMRPFFDRVERIQHVQPVPEEVLGENARTFRRGVDQLGLHGRPLLRNIDGCRGCGVCAFGCPSDAKLATHLTYLPRAQKAGAGIYANARAERILIEGGRARGIMASLLDPVSREPRAQLTIRAKVVVCAAGAVHTPALLANNALANASGQLGRNLRVHPAAAVGAFFEHAIHGWRGTLQSYFVDDWHETEDIMIEVTSSVPSVGAGTFPGVGNEYKEMLGTYPYLASAGLFVSDTSSGTVRARRGEEPRISYWLNKHDAARMVRGLRHTTEIFLAAGARSVHTGIPGMERVSSTAQLAEIEDEAVKPGALRVTAFHPVGTARIGIDPTKTVAGPFGEIHGIPGLFVTDASMLPGCPTVNPQITIMAFATRTADHIARNAIRWFG